MARHRQRRRGDKQRRHASRSVSTLSARDLHLTARVQRLAYTRRQAAEALGVSLATLDRRVVPAIETVKTEWGARLIPVDELERYLAARRRAARATRRRPEPPGRKSGLDPQLVARIRGDYANGLALGEIARRLNADGVQTSQGGRQWWPSTVRAVLVRSSPPGSA
ncbi:MAG: recombinase family protein [Gaiellaceae bacterium]